MAKRVQKPSGEVTTKPEQIPAIKTANNKIFISWSGNESKHVAQALKKWIPDVVEGIEPWISTHDIKAGTRWVSEINHELEQSNFGIICLTSTNMLAPWILFEAGSLAKAVDSSRVVPYLFDVSKGDVEPPLGQFNCVTSDKEGTLNLLISINAQYGGKYEPQKLERKFEKYWPELDQELRSIKKIGPKTTHRKDRELLEELLELARRKGRPDDEIRDLSNQIYRLTLSMQRPSYSTIFDSGFDLVDYIGMVPGHETGRMGDGTLYAYWRSLKEHIEANEDSEDDDVIRETGYCRDIEQYVYQELQRRVMASLDRKSRMYR
jgi:TIR domain